MNSCDADTSYCADKVNAISVMCDAFGKDSAACTSSRQQLPSGCDKATIPSKAAKKSAGPGTTLGDCIKQEVTQLGDSADAMKQAGDTKGVDGLLKQVAAEKKQYCGSLSELQETLAGKTASKSPAAAGTKTPAASKDLPSKEQCCLIHTAQVKKYSQNGKTLPNFMAHVHSGKDGKRNPVEEKENRQFMGENIKKTFDKTYKYDNKTFMAVWDGLKALQKISSKINTFCHLMYPKGMHNKGKLMGEANQARGNPLTK